VRIEPLVGGDLNESVIVSVGSGERFVARRPLSPGSPWAPDIAGQVAAYRLAAEAGAPVPEIVGWDSTALLSVCSRSADRARAALWRDISDLGAETIDPQTAYRAGLAYRRLHARRGWGLGAMQPDGSHPGWARNNYFGPAQDAAAALLEQLGITPDNVRTAAAVLGSREWPLRSRLVHGDASPANTLIDDRAVVALIDFDAAAWADPAIDLAWWWYHSPSSADAFAAGCAKVAKKPTQGRHPHTAYDCCSG
jgi:aminoglycoside phosphotransferase (APT) family kinase protein